MTQRKTFFTPTIQKKIAKLTKIKLDSGERREENGEPVPSPPLFFFLTRRRRRQRERQKSNRSIEENNKFHTFLYISQPLLHGYDVKILYFTSSDDEFSFLF